MARRRRDDSADLDEELQELEIKLNRLRVEYDQYFVGNAKREPVQLRNEVQKILTRFVNEPPIQSALRFRFNSLMARFQSLRALWGRTMREIEAGVDRRSQFRARLAEQGGDAPPPRASRPASKPRGAVDALYDAFAQAQAQTGEQRVSKEQFSSFVQKQAQQLRRKTSGKIKFRVVIADGRAKLKALASKPNPESA